MRIFASIFLVSRSFCNIVVDENITASNLADYLETFEGGMYALRLVMVSEAPVVKYTFHSRNSKQ